jgi:DNA replication protein DnaC
VTLSHSQRRVLDAVMARRSVFFSGAAGSGKSYLLKTLQAIMENLDRSDKIVIAFYQISSLSITVSALLMRFLAL